MVYFLRLIYSRFSGPFWPNGPHISGPGRAGLILCARFGPKWAEKPGPDCAKMGPIHRYTTVLLNTRMSNLSCRSAMHWYQRHTWICLRDIFIKIFPTIFPNSFLNSFLKCLYNKALNNKLLITLLKVLCWVRNYKKIWHFLTTIFLNR